MNVVNMRLRGLRLQQGLTQAECAKKIGISQNTWSYYESGKIINIPLEIKEKIATIFGTQVSDLETPVLDNIRNYPKEIQDWLDKEESTSWVTKAYFDYIQSQFTNNKK